jgi:hypothetical protein
MSRSILRTAEASRLPRPHPDGVSRDIADTLVSVGADLSTLYTFGDLQRGIEEAERLLMSEAKPLRLRTTPSTRASRPVTD